MAKTWNYRRGKGLPPVTSPLPIRRTLKVDLHVVSVESPKLKMFMFEDELLSYPQIQDLGIDIGSCRPIKVKIGTRVRLSDGSEFFHKVRNHKIKNIYGQSDTRPSETIGYTNPLDGKKKSFTITEFEMNFSQSVVDMVRTAIEMAQLGDL
jgi:hypothetical protein